MKISLASMCCGFSTDSIHEKITATRFMDVVLEV